MIVLMYKQNRNFIISIGYIKEINHFVMILKNNKFVKL